MIFSVGQQVEVNSSTYGRWLNAVIVAVSETPFSVTVQYEEYPQQKTITAEMLGMIRPKIGGYSLGQFVEVFSESHGGWLAGSVVDIVEEPYAVTVHYAGGSMQKVVPADRLALLRPATLNKKQIILGSEAEAQAPSTVIFLDVDGVLHSLYGEEIFAPSCCASLERIVRGCPGAGVVLTNQWAHEGQERIGMVDALLRQNGIGGLCSSTSNLQSHGAQEICDWLDQHPEVNRFVVLDDADLLIGDTAASRRLQGRTVRSDKHVGLTSRDAEIALRVLCDGTDSQQASKFAPPVQLSPEEMARASASQAAEAETWESLRSGEMMQPVVQ